MADIKSVTVLTELQDFLDKLPAKPCPEYSGNPDFCTVCKRLNREVAGQCKYSGLEIDGEKAQEPPESEPGSVEFKPVSDDVETKQVIPPESDEEFPMIEIVKPTTTPKKPVEMELLDDIAIEFEVMGDDDEPVEVEALEVEPLGEDEFGDEGEIEVLQFEAVEEVEPGAGDEIAESVVFEPTSTPGSGPMPTVVPAPPMIPAPTAAGAGPRVVPRKRVKLKKRPPVVKKPGTGPKVARKPIPKPKPIKKAKVKLKPKLKAK
jgi:hypothetical protein